MGRRNIQSRTNTVAESQESNNSADGLRGQVIQIAQGVNDTLDQSILETQKAEMQENLAYLGSMLGVNNEHGVYQKGTLETCLEQVCPYDPSGKMPEYPGDPGAAA